MRRALAFFTGLALLSVAMALPATAVVKRTTKYYLSDLTTTCSTVSGSTGGVAYSGGYRVNADDWTGAGITVVRACSPSHWTATVEQRGAPATGVKTYPDSERTFTDWEHCSTQPTVGSFSSLDSTYALSAPNTGSWDVGYDIYLNGGACAGTSTELMILNQWRGVDWPTSTRTTIDGVAYDVDQHAGFIQLRRVHQNARGAVNLLAVLDHYVRPPDTLLFVQYGAEVLTTLGQPERFTLSAFKVDATVGG